MLFPVLLMAQGGGSNTTANVNGWSSVQAGVHTGLMNLAGVHLEYAHREFWTIQVEGGTNGLGAGYGGQVGYFLTRNQEYVKRKGFTRSYRVVYLGYTYFTEWSEEFLDENPGLPFGHAVQMRLGFKTHRKHAHEWQFGAAFMLTPDNASPLYPVISYRYSWQKEIKR